MLDELYELLLEEIKKEELKKYRALDPLEQLKTFSSTLRKRLSKSSDELLLFEIEVIPSLEEEEIQIAKKYVEDIGKKFIPSPLPERNQSALKNLLVRYTEEVLKTYFKEGIKHKKVEEIGEEVLAHITRNHPKIQFDYFALPEVVNETLMDYQSKCMLYREDDKVELLPPLGRFISQGLTKPLLEEAYRRLKEKFPGIMNTLTLPRLTTVENYFATTERIEDTTSFILKLEEEGFIKIEYLDNKEKIRGMK